jgi:hypothetical protein
MHKLAERILPHFAHNNQYNQRCGNGILKSMIDMLENAEGSITLLRFDHKDILLIK